MSSSEAEPTPNRYHAAAWEAREAGQASAFDAIGQYYDEAFPRKEGQYECVRKLIGRLPPNAHVLDLGCGTGLPTARQLVDAGARVTGTEISPRMLETARRNVPEARFVQTDVVDLDPAAQSYHAVVAFFVLLCLPRAHIPKVLELIRDSLAPEGVFCMGMVEADADDLPIPFLGEDVRVSGYTRDEMRAVVEASGFAVEDEQILYYAPASTQAYPEVQQFLTCSRAD